MADKRRWQPPPLRRGSFCLLYAVCLLSLFLTLSSYNLSLRGTWSALESIAERVHHPITDMSKYPKHISVIDKPDPVYQVAPRKFIVVSAFKEELGWLRRVRLPKIVYVRGETAGPYISLLPNIGNEAHPYLRFIIDYYDNLPNQTLFLHGHETSWHNKEPKSGVIPRLRWDHEYVDLAYYIYQRVDQRRILRMMGLLWRAANLTSFMGEMPPLMETHCCAEFIVSKARILRHPRSMYEGLLEWVLNPPLWLEEEKSRERGLVLEMLWPVIFGEPLIQDRYGRCHVMVCNATELETDRTSMSHVQPFRDQVQPITVHRKFISERPKLKVS